MAMRGRGGRATVTRPPRLIVGRVYEDFKPMSEWRQEDDYDTLLVYLPGFQKEYIKVTTEDVNTVRVRGERLVSENKWSRFQQDFRVPENCEMRGIRARFDGGILTITMPRKIITSPPTTTTPTQVITPKPQEPAPFRTAKQDEESNAALESRKEADDKPQTPLERTTLPPEPVPTKQEPSKTTPETKEFTFGSISPKKDRYDVAEILRPENHHKAGVAGKAGMDEGKAKQTLVKEKKKMGLEGLKQVEEKKVGKGIGRRGLNEERKMLVNMGVGVLVIVALGVHVSYTIGLIGKGK